MIPDNVASLSRTWRDQARTLDLYDDSRGASILRRLAAELDGALAGMEDEPLTIPEAVKLSGYSADHLRHLVATGQIPNVGRKGSPRIRRGDLPRKPSMSAA